MQKIHWEVHPIEAPAVVRYCKHCGTKSEFISSELFRVNANSNKLFIWLIYKCHTCETTWKMEIYSNISPQYLAPKLLDKYTNNDKELARLHACDIGLVKRNGAEQAPVMFEIIGSDYNFEEPTEITISSEFQLDLKVSTILREKLNLSRSAFEKLLDEGKITSEHDLRKCKINLGNDIIIFTSNI